jgi:hypothetical protein
MTRGHHPARVITLIAAVVLLTIACNMDVFNHSLFESQNGPTSLPPTLNPFPLFNLPAYSGTGSRVQPYGGLNCTTTDTITLTQNDQRILILDTLGPCLTTYNNSCAEISAESGLCHDVFQGRFLETGQIIFTTCALGQWPAQGAATFDQTTKKISGQVQCIISEVLYSTITFELSEK